MSEPLPLLEAAGERSYSDRFRALWPVAIEWVEPYYDSIHLRHTAKWVARLDPEASEPMLIAALTHDIERHFPGGTQPDKRAGAWDDVAYNTRHARRSADIVGDWLREQEMLAEFVDAAVPPILEHEFGGSAEGDLIQAADSISFLEVNGHLVIAWVLNGETSMHHALRKLDWMYERIQRDDARTLAGPYYERSRATLREDVARAVASS
jgi:hypothetical protein